MPIKSTSTNRPKFGIRRRPDTVIVEGDNSGCGWEMGCCLLEILMGCLPFVLLLVFLIGTALTHLHLPSNPIERTPSPKYLVQRAR